MAKKSKATTHWLQTTAVRVTRVHFVYVAAYIASIIVFDMWNLYTHMAIAQLWTAAGVMLAVNTVLWYVARMNFNNTVYAAVILLLVIADIVFASYNVLWQRGLASKSVMLYTVPIIAAAVLRSRSALLGITTLCAAAYSTVSVRYFFQHYGENYRVELYGTVGFYCAIFFVLAGLLAVIILPKTERF